ncbi:MAG: PEP-CTERM sorting domain-containing protein [Caulobacteraceae bacterium]
MTSMRALLSGAAALATASALAVAGHAAVLYDNGPINGQTLGWTISNGYSVSDSFTLTHAATVTGVDFGAWNYSGDTISSVDWSISTAAFGGSASTALVSDSFQYTNSFGYDINADSFSTGSVTLSAGTYYLTLQNAGVPNGDPAYWDQNSGPSTAYDSAQGQVPSESFQILGAGGVPEPGSWGLMIVGLGLIGLALRGNVVADRQLAALRADVV